MADLPFDLAEPLAARLRAALDVEGKIPRALEALGPLADRRVGFLDVPPGPLRDRLGMNAREAANIAASDPLVIDLPDGSLDVVVSLWSGFRGVDAPDVAEVDRVLAPEGRLLVVHDYGRDDVSALVDGEAPQYRTWGRRDGAFLAGGEFKIRVLHCFWTFESIADAKSLLEEAFGAPGIAVGERLKRPRLSWNVAVYHRWRGGTTPEDAAEPVTNRANA